MPIPLGIFAVAGAGGAVGAYEQIATTFGTGSSTSITFSSIPQTYKHLQIRAAHRVTTNTQSSSTFMRINGVTSGSYNDHHLTGTGGGVGSSNRLSATEMLIGLTPGIADTHAGSIIDILEYASTTKNKVVRTITGQLTGTRLTALYSGATNSTNAVSSITIFANDNFATTARFSLYGLRG
jgi:hypothetical protein